MPKTNVPRFGGFLKIYGPAFLVAILGFVVAYQFVEPAPPARLAITTGSSTGAYQRFARRYREILARQGVELEVRESRGSAANLEALQKSQDPAALGFVQGGMEAAEGSMPMLSLASLYFEPLWVFYRGAAVARLTDFAGKRMAVGEKGSGTRDLALTLLRENGIAEGNTLDVGGKAAAQGLLKGEVDVAFFVTSVESSLVDELLRAEGVRLMSFSRSKAYTRRLFYLSSVELPAGVVDLEKNVPSEDVTLLATSATLVAREDLHPALIDLVLQAASEIHSEGGIFENPGQFPSPEFISFPLSKEAKRYFVHGPPFLQRYLPFWAASLIDRLKVMLLPVLVLLIPLFKVVPPTYRWRVRSRIYRWYKELRSIQERGRGPVSAEDRHKLRAELDRIQDEVSHVSVPLSYADELYDLQLHVRMVRDSLEDDARVPAPQHEP